jgi:hypothetical protein
MTTPACGRQALGGPGAQVKPARKWERDAELNVAVRLGGQVETATYV